MFRNAVSSLWITVVLVVWLLAATAQGQGYTNATHGFALTPPAGWAVDERVDEDQNLLLAIISPTQDSFIVIGAEHPGAADPSDGGIARRNAVEREASEGIGGQFPGAEVTFEFATDVGGAEATGFDFEAPDTFGTVLFAVHGGVLYSMAVFAQPAAIDAADDAFSAVLDSIAFTGADAGTVTGSGLDSGNPLVAGKQDPWLGTFVGDQLTLTLQGGGGSYAGQIVFNGEVFPLRAEGGAGQISGTFSSGGGEFAFTAVATGPRVTFATGGATYELRR